MSPTAAHPGVTAKPRGIRQTMSDLHIWVGLLAGWILYAMFLIGTASYFREEISQYARPTLQAPATGQSSAVLVQRTLDQLQATAAPVTAATITLPSARTPWIAAQWRGQGSANGRHGSSSALFDPATGAPLQAADTQGGDFFYAFHFNLHYMPAMWGRWVVGVCAMFMLVAIISGVITHKKIFSDFFTFRWGKGQRSWLDGHALVSVLGLPFHFMITWSGLVILAVLYMPFGLQKLDSPAAKAAVTSEMRFFLPPHQASGLPSTAADLAPMIAQAEARWGKGSVGALQLQNVGDTQARVAVVRAQATRVSTTPHYLLFDGASGALLLAKEHSGVAAGTQGVLYGLHLGRFADTATRWLYFLVSLAGTAMVGTGLVLWTVKRRNQLPDPQRPYFGFRMVERLNIATIAGLSVAMAAWFWANRLLPAGLADRAAWEIDVFFLVWASTLAHAIVRPAKRAWVEQFAVAAVALAMIPLLTAALTERPLWHSLLASDTVYAAMDISLWLLALLHACLAWRIARHAPPLRRPRAARAPARPPVEASP